MSTEHRKVTVTLPEELLERLNEAVPARKRSLFITAAIEEQLALTEQSAASRGNRRFLVAGKSPHHAG